MERRSTAFLEITRKWWKRERTPFGGV